MSQIENSVSSINLKDKSVLLRVDFNVPLKGNELLDDERLVRALPTIEFIADNAKSLKIISHLGRPEETGLVQDKFSLKPVAKKLGELLNKEVKLVNSIKELKSLENISMLENIRFYKGEKQNEEKLSKALADSADVCLLWMLLVQHIENKPQLMA